MKICLDPGHHPSVNGKRSPQVPPGIIEWEFNMSVVMCLSELLHEAGHEVVRTMELGEPSNKSLKERAAIGAACDLMVSVHANASGSSGWNNAKGHVVRWKRWIGRALAKAIHESFLHNLPEIPKRRGGFLFDPVYTGVLTSKKPSALVECAMMTNQTEAAFMANPENQKRIAKAICKGICAHIERIKK